MELSNYDYSYDGWKAREAAWIELETRYERSLNGFERMVDSHWGYCALMIVIAPIAAGIGLLIGMVIA
jgi:hypothetical protein